MSFKFGTVSATTTTTTSSTVVQPFNFGVSSTSESGTTAPTTTSTPSFSFGGGSTVASITSTSTTSALPSISTTKASTFSLGGTNNKSGVIIPQSLSSTNSASSSDGKLDVSGGKPLALHVNQDELLRSIKELDEWVALQRQLAMVTLPQTISQRRSTLVDMNSALRSRLSRDVNDARTSCRSQEVAIINIKKNGAEQRTQMTKLGRDVTTTTTTSNINHHHHHHHLTRGQYMDHIGGNRHIGDILDTSLVLLQNHLDRLANEIHGHEKIIVELERRLQESERIQYPSNGTISPFQHIINLIQSHQNDIVALGSVVFDYHNAVQGRIARQQQYDDGISGQTMMIGSTGLPGIRPFDGVDHLRGTVGSATSPSSLGGSFAKLMRHHVGHHYGNNTT